MKHTHTPTSMDTGAPLAVGSRNGPTLGDMLRHMAGTAYHRADQSSARDVATRYAEACARYDMHNPITDAVGDAMMEAAAALIAHPVSLEMIALARDTILAHQRNAEEAARWPRALTFAAWRAVLSIPD